MRCVGVLNTGLFRYGKVRTAATAEQLARWREFYDKTMTGAPQSVPIPAGDQDAIVDLEVAVLNIKDLERRLKATRKSTHTLVKGHARRKELQERLATHVKRQQHQQEARDTLVADTMPSSAAVEQASSSEADLEDAVLDDNADGDNDDEWAEHDGAEPDDAAAEWEDEVEDAYEVVCLCDFDVEAGLCTVQLADGTEQCWTVPEVVQAGYGGLLEEARTALAPVEGKRKRRATRVIDL